VLSAVVDAIWSDTSERKRQGAFNVHGSVTQILERNFREGRWDAAGAKISRFLSGPDGRFAENAIHLREVRGLRAVCLETFF
jgi:hypothetical protein